LRLTKCDCTICSGFLVELESLLILWTSSAAHGQGDGYLFQPGMEREMQQCIPLSTCLLVYTQQEMKHFPISNAHHCLPICLYSLWKVLHDALAKISQMFIRPSHSLPHAHLKPPRRSLRQKPRVKVPPMGVPEPTAKSSTKVNTTRHS
jgi:hypothetical protein